jgi:two-component system, NarL family, sensor histidine kinase DesK
MGRVTLSSARGLVGRGRAGRLGEAARLARLAERERIGRDLHDLLGRSLSLVAIKVDLAARLFERDPDAARREIAEIERVARDALEDVRRTVAGISAAALDLELARARLALASCGVELAARLDRGPLRPAAENVLALALREATTNVLRHAGARRVDVTLRRGSARAVLEIADDGCGGRLCPGQGLTWMRERAAAVGGGLQVESRPGRGTLLRLTVPLGSDCAESGSAP